MPKLKTVYVCSSCGTQHPKWAGQCSQCGEWNTFVEDAIDKDKDKYNRVKVSSVSVRKISEIEHQPVSRLESGISEFDRVLGGGVVPGSVVLLGGEPGIGKSTITLQVLDKLKLGRIVYVAGEESAYQIGLRAKRLGLQLDHVDFAETTMLEEAVSVLESDKPDFVVIDSIQVMKSVALNSVAGGVSQIRAVTEKITNIAKSKGIPTLIIGHVTKDGELAGPKLLEHLVDAVLYLEGDKINSYRFLKSAKNRYGSTEEVGIFRMDSDGLKEVPDPAAEFIESREEMVVGSALSCAMEGNRPFVIEIQALTSPSSFGYPKRSATGFDTSRLNMIIAVLGKYYGIDLSQQDVFVNVSGGFKVRDTACDLTVMKAIESSFKKQPLKQDTVYIGEISLTGKIKKVAYQDLREKEVKRLGFNVKKSI